MYIELSNIKKIALILLALALMVSLVFITGKNEVNKQENNNFTNNSPVNVLIFNGDGANSISVQGLKDSMDYSNNNNLTPIHFNYSTTDVINSTTLSSYDVLVMPGGDYLLYLENSNIKPADIRSFLSNGKGFVGICAGSYAATINYGWGFAPHIYANYVNFYGTQQVSVTPYGSTLLNYTVVQDLHEENGPGMYKSSLYDPVVKFTSNRTIYENYSAVLDDTYGSGRVILSSPHVEKTNGKPEILIQMILWASKKI